jgi:hypothetical protein
MAYAVVGNVQGRIARHVLTGTTPVTTTQVGEFIDDIDAEINGVLVLLGYVVPVVEPTWFMTRLRALSSDGSAAITLKALFPDAVGPGGSPAYAFYEQRYRAGLKMLKDGAHPKAASGVAAATYFTNHPDEEADLGDLEGDSLIKVLKQF